MYIDICCAYICQGTDTTNAQPTVTLVSNQNVSMNVSKKAIIQESKLIQDMCEFNDESCEVQSIPSFIDTDALQILIDYVEQTDKHTNRTQYRNFDKEKFKMQPFDALNMFESVSLDTNILCMINHTTKQLNECACVHV